MSRSQALGPSVALALATLIQSLTESIQTHVTTLGFNYCISTILSQMNMFLVLSSQFLVLVHSRGIIGLKIALSTG